MAVLGEKALSKYLVDEVQEVYRLQGVKINDKHIETIVRQMLRRVRISDSGDTNLLVGESVDKGILKDVNQKVLDMGGNPLRSNPCSWVSLELHCLQNHGFQLLLSKKPLRFLQASIAGRVDKLRGLKENVSMGRLIPAGTGIHQYQMIRPEMEIEEESLPVGRAYQAPPIEETEDFAELRKGDS